MKMRKIIAVLAAMLMLCSVLPVGMIASAAPGETVLNIDFENGDPTFESDCFLEVETDSDNTYLVWDAAQANWANIYTYAHGVKANTDYEVTFKAMADKDAELQFKINNGWNGNLATETVAVGTEWTDIAFTINSGALTDGAIVTIQAGYEADNAPIFYLDDIKMVEAMDPALIGKLTNGNFETGDKTGWETHQDTKIESAAAHSGTYGAHLIGGGSYGGLLDQLVYATPGKSYEISFWLKVNANGVNIQIKDGDANGANLAGDWVDLNKAGSWKQFTYIVIPTQNSFFINFCGAGNSVAEDAYVDDFTVTELKDPSFDGYIHNGDFETGKTDNWESVWGSAQISIVPGYNGGSAMLVNAGQWQVVRQKVSVTPNTDYVVRVRANNASNMTLLVKSYPADQNVAQAGVAGGEWKLTSLEFHSGDLTEVYICVMGNVAGSSATFDDFFMMEKKPASNDGFLTNGDFETGDAQPWENLWGSCPKAEVVNGGKDSTFALEVVSGTWKHVRQTGIAVEANTDYVVTLWAKNVKDMSLLVKDNGDTTNLCNSGITAGDEWTKVTATFNSGNYTSILLSLMGNTDNAGGIFDNVTMFKKIPASNDGYIINGNFETRDDEGWENVWGSSVLSVEDNGREGGYALNITSGLYKVVRQLVTVEPNTDYKISVWSKNAGSMALLVKDSADAVNIVNTGFAEGDEWTKAEVIFNSGDNTSVYVGVMGNSETASGTFDDFSMGLGCAHEYEYGCSKVCSLCGVESRPEADHRYNPLAKCDTTCNDCEQVTREALVAHTFNHECDTQCSLCYDEVRPEATHTIAHTPYKEATCGTDGTQEYWYCTICGAAWMDAECNLNTTPMRLVISATEEHTFDNDCDATCNGCDYEREVEDHTYTEQVTTEATCGKDGVKTFTCSKCNDSYTEAIPASGNHTYDNACDKDCNVCGGTREVAGHAYTDKVTTEATCGKDGVKTYTCSACGHSYTEAIPASGNHTYDNDCDDTCNVCGGTREVAAHPYTDKVTTEATCGKDGVKTYTCSECGHSYTEAIPASGNHTYDNACDADCNVCGAGRTPADHVYDNACDADCNVCGAGRTPADHVYDNACDADCNVCGAGRTPADHVYDNACDTTCDVCGATREVPKHPYAYVVTTEATCGQDGLKTYTCSACGHSYTEVIPATGNHEYNYDCDKACKVCGLETRPEAAHEYFYACDPVCTICYEMTNPDAAHNLIHVEAKDADCYNDGNIEYWYCEHCNGCWDNANASGMPLNMKMIVIPGGHEYDDDFDVSCNVCGDIREILVPIFTFGGNSVTEDVDGLGFLFTVNAHNVVTENNQYVSGTIVPFTNEVEYGLVRMGAIVSNAKDANLTVDAVNGKTIKNTVANLVYNVDAENGQLNFAVRVTNIPNAGKFHTISARPYIIYDRDGVETIIYGDVSASSYMEALQANAN